MRTLCFKCQKVLTNEDGVRLHSAIFDTRVKGTPPPTADVTWAVCDVCFNMMFPKTSDLCPDCARPKAVDVASILTGACPKWYSIRDQIADDDCANHPKILIFGPTESWLRDPCYEALVAMYPADHFLKAGEAEGDLVIMMADSDRYPAAMDFCAGFAHGVASQAAEIHQLKMSIIGRDKALELLNAGFKSICDDRDTMKQLTRKLAGIEATPRPWRVAESGVDIQSGPLGFLAYVSTAGGRGRTLAEAQANAALIVAAVNALAPETGSR